MTLTELLSTLNSRGVRLSVKGDGLQCRAPAGAITPELRQYLTQFKPELIRLLSSKYSSENIIEPVMRAADLPLSFAQESLWFLNQMDESSTPAYNIRIAQKIIGPIQRALFEEVFNQVIQRHEALRSYIVPVEGKPVLRIQASAQFHFKTFDLSPHSSDDQARRAQEIMDVDGGRSFKTDEPLLLRGLWIKMSESVLVILSAHHLVADAWSAKLLLKEVAENYRLLSSGSSTTSSNTPSLDFIDHVYWQRKMSENGAWSQQVSYWREKLRDVPMLQLPTDRPRPSNQTYQGASESWDMPAKLSKEVRALCRAEGATLFTTLLASFAVLLNRYSGQFDIPIGTSITGRNRREFDQMIGYFVNVLVMRNDLSDQPSFVQLLRRVHQTFLEGLQHQDVPFELLVKELQPGRNAAYNPLFQVFFLLLQTEKRAELTLDTNLENVPVPSVTSKFDLSVQVEDSGEQLTVIAEYNTDFFHQRTIQGMLRIWGNLLRSIVNSPDSIISNYSLLEDSDLRGQLLLSNGTTLKLPPYCSLQDWFTARAADTPGDTALIFEGNAMTYQSLDAESNAIANTLRQKGVGPETLVGLSVDRSPLMVIGLLGILKAGGAYVPLDPTYPVSRLVYMVRDSGLQFLLSEPEMNELLGEEGIQCISPRAAIENGDRQALLKKDIESDNLAYVIYTSGSTGNPKGVQITHRNVLNFIHSMAKEPGFGTTESLVSVTTLSFDISVLELFLPLLVGGPCILASPEERTDGKRLRNLINQSGSHVMQATPSTWRLLLDSGWEGDAKGKFMCGGEAMPRDLANRLCELGHEVWNMYGPTETTVWSTVQKVEPGSVVVPIGKPIANTSTYILDASGQPVPKNVIGALFIGGIGLARGYLNRPDLTSGKFVPDPFSSSPGARMYATGDLGRWNSNGVLECLGRTDSQIKLRGFRIESGEIESVLLEHAQVSGSAVVVHDDPTGKKRLIAYVQTIEEVDSVTLLDWCRAKMPSHMVPSLILFLEALPLTNNGKINRSALPAAEYIDIETQDSYQAPGNDIEHKLAGIWSSVLNVRRVGVNDNFFELGGDSILSLQVVYRAAEKGLSITSKLIFTHQTIAELASVTCLSQKEPLAIITPAETLFNLPCALSPMQEGILFHSLMAPKSGVYFEQLHMALHGDLDRAVFEQAWRIILSRHAVLRSSFMWEDLESPRQQIQSDLEFSICFEDWRNRSEKDQEHNLETFLQADRELGFDLSNAPLMRVTVFQCGDSDWRWVWSFHHILLDGWSLAQVCRELLVCYQSLVDESKLALPEPEPYYRYIEWLMENGQETKTKLYWEEQLGDFTEPNVWAGNRIVQIAKQRAASHKEILVLLSVNDTDQLQSWGRTQHLTLNSLILGAWAQLARCYCSTDDVVFGVTVSGRPSDLDGAETMVGLFINSLPIRIKVNASAPITEWLSKLQDQQLELREYEHSKLTDIQACSGVRQGTSLFDSLFVFENYPMDESLREGFGNISIDDIHFIERNNYPLTVVVMPGQALSVKINYDETRFQRALIEQMGEHLHNLLVGLCDSGVEKLGDWSLLNERDHQALVQLPNQPIKDFLSPATIHQLFEGQAKKHPEGRAVAFKQNKLSYRELDERSNQLAHYLCQRGVGPGQRVGLWMERSLELVISILGILKSGGAYVPMDPSYPRERLQFMAEDSGIEVLLTEFQYVADRPEVLGKISVVLLDQDWDQIELQSKESPQVQVSSQNTAYVIYTSGSTGKPKGVVVTHGNVTRLMDATDDWFGFHERDVWTLFHSYAFDFSVWEIWGALLYGGTLVVVPYMVSRSPESFYQLLIDEGVTVLNQTPSAFRQLMDVDAERIEALSLRYVIFGGEALELPMLRSWFERHGDDSPRLINMYGITETTVHVTYRLLRKEDTFENAGSFIGERIPDLEMYVLDANLNAAPKEIPGELYVGGAGVAAGYLHRPGLTAERFIPNPFGVGRLYRTGDLVRRLMNHDIEYLGRCDSQVKIRGFRIELGEIATVLGRHPSVREAAVRLSSENQQLIAYVVSKQSVEECVLTAFCRESLPDYMIPSSYVYLDALPITAHGKLDYAALPIPEKITAKETQFVAPTTPEEKQLCTIWSDVLDVEDVGIRHNFFDLGGHSLMATRLISRIREQFGKDLELRHLFEHPTVEQLCKFIQNSADQAAQSIRSGIRRSKRVRRAVSVTADGDIHDGASGTRSQD
jgi:amino acid adenylation domain-containing protein